MLAVLAITSVFALSEQLAPALAQSCQTQCTEWDADGACIGHTEICPPRLAPSYGAPPRPHYGAIAYGPTSTAWGYSYGWDSEAKAESTVMKNCSEHGDDCEVAVWYTQQCGAVVSDVGTNYYWGLGDTKVLALADARKSCAGDGGKICQEQASGCSQ